MSHGGDILDSFMTNPSTQVHGKSSAKKEYYYTREDIEEMRKIEEENRRLQMEINIEDNDGNNDNAGSYQPDNEFNQNFQSKSKATENKFGKTAPLKSNKDPFFQFGKKEEISPENEVDALLNEIEGPAIKPSKTSQDFFKKKENENQQKKSALFADLDPVINQDPLSQNSNTSKRPQTADVTLKKKELFGLSTSVQPQFQQKQAKINVNQVQSVQPEQQTIEEAPLNIPSRRRQKAGTSKVNAPRPKTAAAFVDSKQSYENDDMNFFQLQQQPEQTIVSQLVQPQEQSQFQSYSKQLADFYESRWIELHDNYQEQVKIIKENFNEEAKHLRQLNEAQLVSEKTEFDQEIIQIEEKFKEEIKRMTEMQTFELKEKDKQFEEDLQGQRKQNSEYESMLQAYKNFRVGQQELHDAVNKITLQDKKRLNLENYGENKSFAIKNIELNEKERKIKAQEEANIQERKHIQDLNQIQSSFKATENKHTNEQDSLKQGLQIYKDDLDHQLERIKSDYQILEKQYELRASKFENEKKQQNQINKKLIELINSRDQEIQQTLEELHSIEHQITSLQKQLEIKEIDIVHNYENLKARQDQFEKQKSEQELNALKIKNTAKSIKLQHSEVERKQKLLEAKKNEVQLKQLQIEAYLNTLQQQENELNSEKINQESQQQTLHEMHKTLNSKVRPFSSKNTAIASNSITKMTEFDHTEAPKNRIERKQYQRIQNSAERSKQMETSMKKFDFENYKQELGLYENEVEENSQYLNQSKQNMFKINNKVTY